jgi:hypothetical protein
MWEEGKKEMLVEEKGRRNECEKGNARRAVTHLGTERTSRVLKLLRHEHPPLRGNSI